MIDIASLDKRFRAHFINSLGGFKSVCLVASKSKEGVENLAVFSSLVHLGADPALCALVFRPIVSEGGTLKNILDTQVFTINHIHESIIDQAHQTSAKYDVRVSEFEQVNLSPEYFTGIAAPFVQESHIKFSCSFVQKMDIALNNTSLLIAKIEHVIVPQEFIGADGFIQLDQAGTVSCTGLDAYYSTTRIKRLSYAKPYVQASILSNEEKLNQLRNHDI